MQSFKFKLLAYLLFLFLITLEFSQVNHVNNIFYNYIFSINGTFFKCIYWYLIIVKKKRKKKKHCKQSSKNPSDAWWCPKHYQKKSLKRSCRSNNIGYIYYIYKPNSCKQKFQLPHWSLWTETLYRWHLFPRPWSSLSSSEETKHHPSHQPLALFS